jgi:hypothetical protein
MAMAMIFAALFIIMVTYGMLAAVMGWEKF